MEITSPFFRGLRQVLRVSTSVGRNAVAAAAVLWVAAAAWATEDPAPFLTKMTSAGI
jgi:hypothetical protein